MQSRENMKLSRNEKILLKNYLSSLVICICSFISEENVKDIIYKSKTYSEIISLIAEALTKREFEGWLGEDLREDQMNVLTIISEMYLKRNKSKYKTIEKPSEILLWFSILLENSLLKSENIIKRKS